MSAVVLLAESDKGKGSPIGLFVVLLLVIAVFLLYRSMTGHLRRLPEKFPVADDSTDEAVPPGGPTGATAPDPSAGSGTPTGPNGERTGLS